MSLEQLVLHRMLGLGQPENSKAAYLRALELKIAAVEIDVTLVDGELLVVHPATLRRSLALGKALEHTTFDEFLVLFEPVHEIYLDAKGSNTLAPVLSALKAHRTRRPDLLDRIILSIIDKQQVAQIRAQFPTIRILYRSQIGHITELLTELEAIGVNEVCFPLATPGDKQLIDSIECAQTLGLTVSVGVAKTLEEVRQAVTTGADWIVTEYVDTSMTKH